MNTHLTHIVKLFMSDNPTPGLKTSVDMCKFQNVKEIERENKINLICYL